MMRNFLGATGMTEQDLRQSLEEPEFLAAVLDFIVMDDQWVLSCANFAGIAPETLIQARQALPGGNLPHWT